MGGLSYPGSVYPAWRATPGTLTTGSVTLIAAKASNYTRINYLALTNNSVASGVTLVLRSGGTFLHSWSCAARFTTAFGPGMQNPGIGTETQNQSLTLSLSGGNAHIAYSGLGNYSPHPLV